MAVLGPCAATIVALSNVLGINNPRVDNAGTFYALLDPQNQAIGQAADPTSGRNDGFVTLDENGKPIVKVVHYQRATEETSIVPACEGGDVPLTTSLHTLDMYRQTSIDFSWDEMRALCGEAARVFGRGLTPTGERYILDNTPIMNDVHQKIMAKVYKLASDINKDLLTKLNTLVGVNRRTGAVTPKDYALWKANDDRNLRGFNEIVTDYQWMNFAGRPILIGGVELNMFANEMNWASLAQSGVDAAAYASAPVAPYIDKQADAILGADEFIMLAPGFAKLLTWNKYGGIFTGAWGDSEYGQFTIPEFGDDLRFDIQVVKANCPGPVAQVIISARYDLFVPKNIFAAGDPMAGVNGITAGRITKLAA